MFVGSPIPTMANTQDISVPYVYHNLCMEVCMCGGRVENFYRLSVSLIYERLNGKVFDIVPKVISVLLS